MESLTIAQQVTKSIDDAVTSKTSATESQSASFTNMVKSAAESTMEKQHNAAELSLQSIQDPSSVNMQDLISAVSEAELGLQTMIAVRDKTVEAYTKIMDMPI